MKNRPPSLLLIDNYDSFTYNLWDYFCRLGADCRVIRNDDPALLHIPASAFDGMILSPGPQKPADAGMLMEVIRRYHLSKPMLGICLGHQGLGLFFGARLTKAARPMHGKTSRILTSAHPLFSGTGPQPEVMRYHSLLLEDLPSDQLEALAWTESGEIMAMRHHYLPLTGVQFHPESVLTPTGLLILHNWLRMTFPFYPPIPDRIAAIAEDLAD